MLKLITFKEGSKYQPINKLTELKKIKSNKTLKSFASNKGDEKAKCNISEMEKWYYERNYKTI